MNPTQSHGSFSWFELMTTDTSAAKDFYRQLFGWKMEDQPIQGTTYTVVKAGSRQVGGIMSNSDTLVQGSPSPHWGIYVTVDDVDESTKLAESMGAKILVPPSDLPDVGRFAVFADPQGAVLSIITYLTPPIPMAS